MPKLVPAPPGFRPHLGSLRIDDIKPPVDEPEMQDARSSPTARAGRGAMGAARRYCAAATPAPGPQRGSWLLRGGGRGPLATASLEGMRDPQDVWREVRDKARVAHEGGLPIFHGASGGRN